MSSFFKVRFISSLILLVCGLTGCYNSYGPEPPDVLRIKNTYSTDMFFVGNWEAQSPRLISAWNDVKDRVFVVDHALDFPEFMAFSNPGMLQSIDFKKYVLLVKYVEVESDVSEIENQFLRVYEKEEYWWNTKYKLSDAKKITPESDVRILRMMILVDKLNPVYPVIGHEIISYSGE